MTNFNKNCLEAQIQANIDNIGKTCEVQDIAKTGFAASCVSNDRKFSVATGNDLPDLFLASDIPNGTIVFVEQIGVPVVKSNLKWLGLDGRLYRDDTIILELYGWGENSYGSLGDGTTVSGDSPVQEVSSSINWCQVSGGGNHSLALKTSGTLWGWGRNSCGRIGDGTIIRRSSPVQEVSSSTNWCQVSGGSAHSLALKTSGTLWAWGRNFGGGLGDGTTIDRSSPVQEVSSSTDWCQVFGGYEHSLALKTSGTLWGWGRNSSGRIGDGTLIWKCSPVQEVSSSTNWCQVSGDKHSLALKTDNTLWAWGFNYDGIIGDGSTITRSSPVQEVSSSTNWCQVSGGDDHSLALKTSGTLWAWGRNVYGQIGDGTIIWRSSPVQEVSSSSDWCQVSGGSFHSLSLKTSGTLWGWGNNFLGRIGDGTIICRSSPVQEVTSSANWCQVSGGGQHSLAIKKVE